MYKNRSYHQEVRAEIVFYTLMYGEREVNIRDMLLFSAEQFSHISLESRDTEWYYLF